MKFRNQMNQTQRWKTDTEMLTDGIDATISSLDSLVF